MNMFQSGRFYFPLQRIDVFGCCKTRSAILPEGATPANSRFILFFTVKCIVIDDGYFLVGELFDPRHCKHVKIRCGFQIQTSLSQITLIQILKYLKSHNSYSTTMFWRKITNYSTFKISWHEYFSKCTKRKMISKTILGENAVVK